MYALRLMRSVNMDPNTMKRNFKQDDNACGSLRGKKMKAQFYGILLFLLAVAFFIVCCSYFCPKLGDKLIGVIITLF